MFSSIVNTQKQQWLRRCGLLVLLSAALWTNPTSAQIPAQATSSRLASLAPAVEYTPGVVIVKLKSDVQLVTNHDKSTVTTAVSTDNRELNQTLSEIGVERIKALFAVGITTMPRAASNDKPLAHIYQLHLAATTEIPAAIELLGANEAVEYAEPDYIAHAALIPNDPQWNEQWALNAIHAPAAWDVTQGTDTSIIALIDSGIDWTHPDLAGRLWENDEIANNGIDDDQNGKIDDIHGWNFVTSSNNVTDANGHGTQVAGVAGAAGNNGVGVAGLCWQCPLMPVVAMQANGVANYSTIAEAVLYAADNGADVINLSLGGYADSKMLREAIAEATTTTVIVAAAGNDDDTAPFYPAAYDDVIAVAATDAAEQKTIFSNYGPWVDITAPGDMILTTTAMGYATLSGTSVATPFVAGAAGLLKSVHPTWSPAMITWQILNTTTPLNGLAPRHSGQLGYGRLDVGSALMQSPEARVQIEGYTLNGESNGRPAPGQSFPLVLTVRNLWMPGESLLGSLTVTDSYVTITDPQSTFGTIGPGATNSNSTDPFQVTLQPDTPYNRVLTFTLTLSGENGFMTSISFPLQVRASVETLGNTQYIEDTTWTNDKTYILDGSVIVGQGITLTIQPGTVVTVNPDKFIRIDGTLVARGTGQNPIVLRGASTDTEAKWEGIRFTDTALSATFNISGTYRSGSILQHVEMANAHQAVAAGTVTPYMADSHFHHNYMAIVTSRGVMQIANNLFTENQTAIFLDGGHPIVTRNQFIGNRGWGWATAIEGNGAPQIIDNTFTEQHGESTIRIAAGAFPSTTVQVKDNRIVNNTGRIVFIGAETLEFEHNLIANNRPNCTGSACAPNDIGIMSIENYQSSSTLVQHNTMIHNEADGLQLVNAGAGSWVIANNNLFGNGQYDLYLNSGTPGTQNFTVTTGENYWNIDASAIAGRIHDCTIDENGCDSSSSTLGKITDSSPLPEPVQTAPAFVRKVDFEPEPVGLNQVGTVTLDFSRPMITDTSPIVTFHDARRGTTQEFSTNSARNITQDTMGRTWFSTGHGVNMFDGRQWHTFTTANSGLGNNDIFTVYGAANGDVWFGGVAMAPNETGLSKLQGSTWITYSEASKIDHGMILAIGEEANGVMWFGVAGQGVFRFDGTTWQQFTTADGLSSNDVRKIVRDTQNRMWFMTNLSSAERETSSLDVFDGIHWQSYNKATGLPASLFTALLADRQGRVWVSSKSDPGEQPYVAMFDDLGWHVFGPIETNGHPFDDLGWHVFGPIETNGRTECSITDFAQAPNGAIWMKSCDRMIIYQAGSWDSVDSVSAGFTRFIIDNNGNFWYNNMRVDWIGLDYQFEDGQWLSNTRYQGTHNFTALIPQGLYSINVSGAKSTDGNEAHSSTANPFRVDFGTAANPTSPIAPIVTAENDGTLTTVSASWHTDSSNIDQHRYAIGTTPGARNVLGWTYLKTSSMTRNDLALTQGQTYYVSVQAHNTFGLWSASGVSNPITGGVVTVSPTPGTPTPGGATATPVPSTPTSTIVTPTPTPPATQLLNSTGYTVGAPGSRFVFIGSGFPPNTELGVAVTRLSDIAAANTVTMLGTVTSDADGHIRLTVVTDMFLLAGRYRLAIGSINQATTEFIIDPTAPLRQPDPLGAIVTIAEQVFLPFVQR